MNNVNPNELNESCLQISEIINLISSGADEAFNACDRINAFSTILNGYIGQKVAGSESVRKVDESSQFSTYKRTWSEWKITGHDIAQTHSTNIQKELDDLADVASEISSELIYMEDSTSVIDAYFSKMQDTLSSYEFDADIASKSFEILNGKEGEASKISWDEYKAADGDCIDSNKILTQYWTDAPLEFSVQPNGTVLITQGGVGMGFTTMAAAIQYLESLKNGYENKNNKIEKTKEEKTKEEKTNEEDLNNSDDTNNDYSWESVSESIEKGESPMDIFNNDENKDDSSKTMWDKVINGEPLIDTSEENGNNENNGKSFLEEWNPSNSETTEATIKTTTKTYSLGEVNSKNLDTILNDKSTFYLEKDKSIILADGSDNIRAIENDLKFTYDSKTNEYVVSNIVEGKNAGENCRIPYDSFVYNDNSSLLYGKDW